MALVNQSELTANDIDAVDDAFDDEESVSGMFFRRSSRKHSHTPHSHSPIPRYSSSCPVSGQASTSGVCPITAQGRTSKAPPDVAFVTTDQGCTCKSKCDTSFDVSFYRCYWCRTKNSCGKWGFFGRWDYCTYKPSVPYEAQRYWQKQAALWARIKSDPKRSPGFPSIMGMLRESMNVVFDNWQETLPEGYNKILHGLGVVCPFEVTTPPVRRHHAQFQTTFSPATLLRTASVRRALLPPLPSHPLASTLFTRLRFIARLRSFVRATRHTP